MKNFTKKTALFLALASIAQATLPSNILHAVTSKFEAAACLVSEYFNPTLNETFKAKLLAAKKTALINNLVGAQNKHSDALIDSRSLNVDRDPLPIRLAASVRVNTAQEECDTCSRKLIALDPREFRLSNMYHVIQRPDNFDILGHQITEQRFTRPDGSYGYKSLE